MTVLHAAKICLGQSISDTKIREGKLRDLLIKEDFDVSAQVNIFLDVTFLLFTYSSVFLKICKPASFLLFLFAQPLTSVF